MSLLPGSRVARPHEVEPTGGLTREFRHGRDGKVVVLGFSTIILIVPRQGRQYSAPVRHGSPPRHQRCLECPPELAHGLGMGRRSRAGMRGLRVGTHGDAEPGHAAHVCPGLPAW